MILCAAKNSLLKNRLSSIFDSNIKYCPDIFDIFEEIPKYEKIAIIIENSAFEITGFMFFLIINKLYPKYNLPAYIILTDTNKAEYFNRIMNVDSFYGITEINNLKNSLFEINSPGQHFDKFAAFQALNDILSEEKVKAFIIHYSNYILSHLSDPNIWFDEYVQFINTITGVKKIILKFYGNETDTVFSSVHNIDIVFDNLITTDNTKRTVMIYSSETEDIKDNEKYSVEYFQSYGAKKGKCIFFFDTYGNININFDQLLLPVKQFYWYYQYQIIKEKFLKNSNEKKYLQLLKNEFFPGKTFLPNNLKLISKNIQHIPLDKQRALFLLYTGSENISNTLAIYLFKKINVDKLSELGEIAESLNMFINKNLLIFHPLPAGLLLVNKNKIQFTATSGIPLLVKDINEIHYIETETPYFGTYSNITCDIKEFNLQLNNEYFVYPDAFFMTFKEKKTLTKKIQEGNF